MRKIGWFMAQGKKSIGEAKDVKPQGGKKSVEHTLRVYLWIVGELYLAPHGLTLKELNERWVPNKELSGGKEMSSRMLSNYREQISEIFGVSITCDRKTNTYSILLSYSSASGDSVICAMAIYHYWNCRPELVDRGAVKKLVEKQRRVLFNLRKLKYKIDQQK